MLTLRNFFGYYGLVKIITRCIVLIGVFLCINLSPKTIETDLAKSFVEFGEISSSGVLRSGKGFVNYERKLSALKALGTWMGRSLEVRGSELLSSQ